MELLRSFPESPIAMKNAPFLNLVLAVILALALGYLLVIGRPILVPIVTAVISVYVMVTASNAMQKLPGLRRLPAAFLRIVVLIVFALVLYGFAVVVASTVTEITRVAPTYQENLTELLAGIEKRYDLDAKSMIDQAVAVTFGNLDLQAIILAVLGGFTSVGMSAFLIVVYATFLIAERSVFSLRISAALPIGEQAQKVDRIIGDINSQIGLYLTVKTLINIILGAASYVILLMLGADFALFWAIVIALLNYIPYVGSLLAVFFPVALSVAQTGSLLHTIILAALLIGAQTYVGNFLEPRMIGRQLNLSPFVVLVALSIWTALWGVAGAILAIPMTSMVVIVLMSFDDTRFLGILLSERVENEQTGH